MTRAPLATHRVARAATMARAMTRSNARWCLFLLGGLLLLPGSARATGSGTLRVGPELHLPWTAGARLEWRPIRLVQPSLSLGYAPSGAVRGLRHDRPSPAAFALALRVTAQPLPLMGLSFNAGFRAFLSRGVALPAFELGIGWRLKLFGIAWAAEVGAFLGDGLTVPYVGLGAYYVFNEGK